MADTKEDIRRKLESKLLAGQSIGSADAVAESSRSEPTDEPDPTASVETEVPPEAKKAREQDTKIGALSGPQVTAKFAEGLSTPDTLEITPAHKEAFLDAMVGDTRFEQTFELFGGRVPVTLQSRTNHESTVLLEELGRQVRAGEIVSQVMYAYHFRIGVLRFQVKRLNGVEYTLPSGNLSAVASLNEKGEKEITAPGWVDEAHGYYGQMGDGLMAALYQSVMRFDTLYWTLVKGAHNQDF